MSLNIIFILVYHEVVYSDFFFMYMTFESSDTQGMEIIPHDTQGIAHVVISRSWHGKHFVILIDLYVACRFPENLHGV